MRLKRCRIIGTSLNNAECLKWFKMVTVSYDYEGLLIIVFFPFNQYIITGASHFVRSCIQIIALDKLLAGIAFQYLRAA